MKVIFHIGISAGIDNHRDDRNGLLLSEDYTEIGSMVHNAARRCQGACCSVPEGGCNHSVPGTNVSALLRGLSVV
jgi:acetoin utilization deacetylase AcuC-like enzyme